MAIELLSVHEFCCVLYYTTVSVLECRKFFEILNDICAYYTKIQYARNNTRNVAKGLPTTYIIHFKLTFSCLLDLTISNERKFFFPKRYRFAFNASPQTFVILYWSLDFLPLNEHERERERERNGLNNYTQSEVYAYIHIYVQQCSRLKVKNGIDYLAADFTVWTAAHFSQDFRAIYFEVSGKL